MGYDLPGVYNRPDRGWTPPVRGLVGAQLNSDERMALMIANSMDVNDLLGATLTLSALAASLLALTPWADGCTDVDELLERWNVSTARLVAEVHGYDLDGDDP
jgi:hypothetical protein